MYGGVTIARTKGKLQIRSMHTCRWGQVICMPVWGVVTSSCFSIINFDVFCTLPTICPIP